MYDEAVKLSNEARFSTKLPGTRRPEAKQARNADLQEMLSEREFKRGLTSMT